MIHRSKSRSVKKKRSQKKNVKPEHWPSTTAWPLPKGVKIISIMESYPPKFQLSNGKVVNGVMNNNNKSTFIEGDKIVIIKDKALAKKYGENIKKSFPRWMKKYMPKRSRKRKLDGGVFTPIKGHLIEEQDNNWLYVVEMGDTKGTKISDVAFTNKQPTGTIIGKVPNKDQPIIRREAKQYALKNGIRW